MSDPRTLEEWAIGSDDPAVRRMGELARKIRLMADESSVAPEVVGDGPYDSDRPHRPETISDAGRDPVFFPEPDLVSQTVGELIDRLTIVNNKIWHLEEDIKAQPNIPTLVAEKALKVRRLNMERSQLKNAITNRIEGAAARREVKI